MRTKQRKIILGGLIAAIGTVPAARSQADDEASRFAGTWRGGSVCVAKNTTCHDESVVYRVQKLPALDHVTISADKIVSGKAINMGSLEFRYDQQSKSWVCQYPQGLWRLTVGRATVNGTLTQPDGTLFRRIELRKDP
jgi:hypothetical protein